MPLTLVYSRRSAKDLAGLPTADRGRTIQRLNAYADMLEAPHHDVIHLVGTGEFRLRVGDWRVVFRITGERLDVLRIGHRREVYK